MSNHKVFCVSIDNSTQVDWDAFNEMMNEINQANNREIEQMAKDLGISEGAASDVWYLRTRSRWSQEKEDYLIKLAREEKELPNIMEDFEVP